MMVISVVLLCWNGLAYANAAQTNQQHEVGGPAAAGEALPTAQGADTAAQTTDDDQQAAELSATFADAEPIEEDPAGVRSLAGFWPDLRGPVLTWFAVFVILLLTLQSKPLLTWRNLDGLILAAACLLLALRANVGATLVGLAGQTWQWWSYLALVIVAAYWLLRGLHLVFVRAARVGGCNVSSAGMLVLVLAGLAFGVDQVARAPISAGSRDAMIGGVQVVKTGKLPYGDVSGHDSRSPLLYLLHAGAVEVSELVAEHDELPGAITWETKWRQIPGPWLESAGMVAVRVINAVLLVITAAGLYVIGRRLHSSAIAFALLAIFCVFPGVVECLPRPEIMLPTALLTWSLAFALLPGVGGLLSTLCLVFAGLAWPWAWLALPVAWAYFFRRGWHVVGSTVGLLGGAAACIAGLTWLTLPTIPRANGALAAAGLQPAHAARLTADGTLVVETEAPQPDVPASLLAPAWRFLVGSEDCDLGGAAEQARLGKVEWPNGVDAGSVFYRTVRASEPALAELQPAYRDAVADQPDSTRVWVALRTVLEATWCPPPALKPPAPIKGAWELWAGTDVGQADWWTLIRRCTKIAAGLVALVLAVVFLFGRPLQPYQLVGALVAVCSAALVASELGAVSNLAWLMPMVLALLAAEGRQSGPVAPKADRLPSMPVLADLGPAPRISVEK
jgi:hypothetical protein